MNGEDQKSPAPRPRRTRYSGSHPRRFEQRYKEHAGEQYPGMHAHIRAQGRTPAGTHVPVLLAETLAALAPRAGETVVDCTLGYGGHAEVLLRAIGARGLLIGLEHDAQTLERTRARLLAAGARDADAAAAGAPAAARAPAAAPDGALGGLMTQRTNFAGLLKVMAARAPDGADVLLADLGVSSMQIDDPRRGFSYKHDGPLDMRMDERIQRTAADWLAVLSEAELATALTDTADEPDAAAIARAVVVARGQRPLRSTRELAELVLRVKGARRGDDDTDAHAAARTFQALRMLVNDELAALRRLLRTAPDCLRGGGRVALISFHSGEDRLVKHALEEGLATGVYAEIAPAPLRATPAERGANPRSAAARLRWARRAAPEPREGRAP